MAENGVVELEIEDKKARFAWCEAMR